MGDALEVLLWPALAYSLTWNVIQGYRYHTLKRDSRFWRDYFLAHQSRRLRDE